MRTLLVLSALAVLAAFPSAAAAGIIQHDSEASWLTAAGGAADLTEDFSGFSSDTSFVSTPVTLSMGTLVQTTLETAFRNIVDVPPLTYSDNNGTSHASMFVNWPELPGDGTIVKLTFTTPLTAWGATFFSATSAEGLLIDVVDTGGTTLATLVPAANDTFLGFVGDAGETAGSVVFRSGSLIAGGTGEGFGMDDVLGLLGPPAAVPEPGTLALFGLGFAAVALATRRHRRSRDAGRS